MIHLLEQLSPLPIELVWHENKRVYFSIKKVGPKMHFRLHRLFFDAPTPVLKALLHYAKHKDAPSRAIVRQMAHLYFSQNHIDPLPLNARGKVYDLEEILSRIAPLLGLTHLSIGWSQERSRTFSSIVFGTYNAHERQIRIHPLLDDKEVPLYFLEFIVYHEMLHAVYPVKMDIRGRRTVHSRAFREKEKEFPRYKEATAWAKQSLTFFKAKYHGRS